MPSLSRRSLIALATAAGLGLAGCAGSPAATPAATPAGSAGATTASGQVLQIGIAQIVDHPSLNDLRDGFKEGMAAARLRRGNRRRLRGPQRRG